MFESCKACYCVGGRPSIVLSPPAASTQFKSSLFVLLYAQMKLKFTFLACQQDVATVIDHVRAMIFQPPLPNIESTTILSDKHKLQFTQLNTQ